MTPGAQSAPSVDTKCLPAAQRKQAKCSCVKLYCWILGIANSNIGNSLEEYCISQVWLFLSICVILTKNQESHRMNLTILLEIVRINVPLLKADQLIVFKTVMNATDDSAVYPKVFFVG